MLYKKLLLLLLSAVLLWPMSAAAQKKKKEKEATTEKKDAPKKKSIASITDKCEKYEGLFNLYQNKKTGEVYMLVKKDQLEKEYIYFSHTVDGVLEAGHFRGGFQGNEVFTIQKNFDKLSFVVQNTSFYFDPDNAVSRAAEANISPAMLVVEKIEAEENDQMLIKADKLFLAEIFNPIKPNYPPTYKGFKLGKLSKEKTRYTALKNYPENTAITVAYTFDNPNPRGKTSAAVTDPRYITVHFQHTLIEMPQNEFVATIDDPRVGYFITQVSDMTSTSATNYKDLVHKWHLKKKDPSAALSEPEEPIVFWIENTTPEEFRETIMKAGLAWNEAFEKAGFKNAVQIKVQPDDADWEADDIRYNVLRWTSSPQPPFGGYGPSFVNPRTGQILGADIMLEMVFVTNRLRQEQVFEVAALGLDEWTEEEKLLVEDHLSHQHCSLGHHLQMANTFGTTTLNLLEATDIEVKKYIEDALYFLVLLEMGHTLGLNHNMKASQLHTPSQLNDKERVKEMGLVGSVMDYPMPNIALNKAEQTDFFTRKPGPYAQWAIEFAYGTVDDKAMEEARLQKVLARSMEPELTFGNDADDMRSPGKAIDPRVMINDMSSDMITYGVNRIKMIDGLVAKLKDKYLAKNSDQSFHELRNQYFILTGTQQQAARGISRFIGGVYVERAFVGQKDAKVPFTPVSYQDQKRAMKALNQYIFSPNAFKAPSALYRHLQMQRRGYNFFTSPEDPKIHDRVLRMQSDILSHLLHPNTTKRILDSEVYGNQYKLGEMMTDLTNGIFKTDLAGNVNGFRQNLQKEYVKELVKMAGLEKKAMHTDNVQAMAFYQLMQIEKMMKANQGGDIATKAHRTHLQFMIERATDD
ncbi:MAG: zinc-dependent metalloprotease [Thermonemataceae bacterium]